MLKGKTITLVTRTQTGTDSFDRPIYTPTEVSVDNVLYAPASTTDILSNIDLTGKKAVYTLAIPKGDTHDWTDCTVKFLNHTWKSVGFPQVGIEEMVPLEWHTKVTVELCE